MEIKFLEMLLSYVSQMNLYIFWDYRIGPHGWSKMVYCCCWWFLPVHSWKHNGWIHHFCTRHTALSSDIWLSLPSSCYLDQFSNYTSWLVYSCFYYMQASVLGFWNFFGQSTHLIFYRHMVTTFQSPALAPILAQDQFISFLSLLCWLSSKFINVMTQ